MLYKQRHNYVSNVVIFLFHASIFHTTTTVCKKTVKKRTPFLCGRFVISSEVDWRWGVCVMYECSGAFCYDHEWDV